MHKGHYSKKNVEAHMISFDRWWRETGCRNHKCVYVEDWARVAWNGALKEAGLASPPIPCETQDGENFKPTAEFINEGGLLNSDSQAHSARGDVFIAEEGQHSRQEEK